MATFKLGGELNLDTKGYDRGVAHAKRETAGLGSFIKQSLSFATGLGIANAAGSIFDMGKSLLFANAGAEQLRVTLDIATGSATKSAAVFDAMQAMAAATPFEFPELIGSAARIESFGISSRDVMGIIGDTAAGTMRSLDQVTAAYLDAGMGQFIRLQELGIDASIVGDNVVLKWIENGQQMVKEVDKNNGLLIQSTVAAIWNDKYAGAMKKQSKTFLGQWSTLKDNARLTAQRMTGSFFGFSKNVLAEANNFFNRFNKKLEMGLGVWGALMSSLHTTLNKTLGPTAGGLIVGTLRAIGDGAGYAFGKVKAFGDGIVALSRYVGAAIDDGDKLNDWLTHLPPGFQRTARGIAMMADALFDTIRAFRSGGLSAAFDELGRIQGDRLLSGMRTLGEEAWGALTGVLGDLAREGVKLADWTLNTAVPSVTGWVADHITDAWGGIATAAGWVWDGSVALGEWTIETAVPTMTGWVKDWAGDVWSGIAFAAGFIWTKTAELGAWTLETVQPAISGFLDDPSALTTLLRTEIGEPIVTLIRWKMNLPTPEIAFAGGFSAGQLTAVILQKLGAFYFDLPWYARIGLPAAIILPFLLPVALTYLIAREIGWVNIKHFATWTLQLAGAASFGFVLGFVEQFDSDVAAAMALLALNVTDFTAWKLILGVPAVEIVADFGTSLGKKVRELLTGSLLPIDVGAASGEGGIGAATLMLDVSGARRDFNALKADLGEWSAKKWTSKLALTDTLATNTLNNLVTDIENGWETDTFTTKLAADDKLFNDTLRAAEQLGLDFENTDPPFTTRLSANRGLFDDVLWDAIQAGLGFQRTTFTAALSLNIQPALNALAYLDQFMPHSPARRGPFSRVPNFSFIPESFERSMRRIAHAMPNVAAVRYDGGSLAGAGVGGGVSFGPTYGPTYIQANDPMEYARARLAQDVGMSRP